MDTKTKLSAISKYKYPLIVLAIGLGILLFPSKASVSESAPDNGTNLEQLLSCTEGVGAAKVILSENGVVVVCRGADNPKVRLDIIQAIGSYTGFGSDKITVLQMADQRLGGE